MVAYSFKSGFVPLLEAGSKQQTIRLPRKRHAAAGETLQLYYGMRTRQCRLIGTATCLAAQSVVLRLADNIVQVGEVAEIIAADELDAFAIRDGFTPPSGSDLRPWIYMKRWWRLTHGEIALFRGVLIDWGETFQAPGAGQGPDTNGVRHSEEETQ